MNPVERHIQSIRELCIRHEVEKLYLFGSVLRNDFNPDSDIDFVVRFKAIDLQKYSDNYFDLQFSLEDLFQRPIDLLEEHSIRNPYFLQDLNKSKRLIYEE